MLIASAEGGNVFGFAAIHTFGIYEFSSECDDLKRVSDKSYSQAHFVYLFLASGQ